MTWINILSYGLIPKPRFSHCDGEYNQSLIIFGGISTKFCSSTVNICEFSKEAVNNNLKIWNLKKDKDTQIFNKLQQLKGHKKKKEEFRENVIKEIDKDKDFLKIYQEYFTVTKNCLSETENQLIEKNAISLHKFKLLSADIFIKKNKQKKKAVFKDNRCSLPLQGLFNLKKKQTELQSIINRRSSKIMMPAFTPISLPKTPEVTEQQQPLNQGEIQIKYRAFTPIPLKFNKPILSPNNFQLKKQHKISKCPQFNFRKVTKKNATGQLSASFY